MASRKWIAIFCIASFNSLTVNAVVNSSGSRSHGLGGYSVGLIDVWSVVHNQAGLARLKKAQLETYFQSRFLLKETRQNALSWVIPLGKGRGIGLSWSSFGFKLYRQNQLSLGFGMPLSDKFALGIGIHYLNSRFQSEYGKAHKVMASLGMLFNFTPKLTIAINIFNVNRARMTDAEYLPVNFKMAFKYKFSNVFFLGFQIDKGIGNSPSLHFGIEYKVKEALVLRLGISSDPWSYSFGLAYQFKSFNLGISSSFHPVLGITPGVSLGYAGFP